MAGYDARSRKIALAQGTYWMATGLWPVVHLGSRMKVTGRKKGPWVVRTVGLLLAAAGVTLLLAGARRRVTPAKRVGPLFHEGHGRWDIAPGETVQPGGRRDVVTEASMESFPASDPPAFR